MEKTNPKSSRKLARKLAHLSTSLYCYVVDITLVATLIGATIATYGIVTLGDTLPPGLLGALLIPAQITVQAIPDPFLGFVLALIFYIIMVGGLTLVICELASLLLDRIALSLDSQGGGYQDFGYTHFND